ncbi:hypothetical protein E3J79_02200 [Candidatus Dependentiae bacterium]|nr:MAG: hypothetical protein E3J79_02200 [Candidatus Dependentiae bacterium]
MFLRHRLTRTFILLISLSPFSAYSFSLKSLSPYKYIDKKCCEYWGSEEASSIYQEQLRIFLSHLGINNPDSIPIRKFSKSASSVYKVYACARPTGIWINEYLLLPEEKLTSLQLYVLAHEASHFALQHKRIIILLSLLNCSPYLPIISLWTNILTNVFFLHKLSVRVAKDPSWIETKSFSGCIYLLALSNTWVARLKEVTAALTVKFSQKIEKEADLEAAKMLCKLGYIYVVEDRIRQCKENLEKGLNYNFMHPRLEQEIKYLQQFLDEWKSGYRQH